MHGEYGTIVQHDRQYRLSHCDLHIPAGPDRKPHDIPYPVDPGPYRGDPENEIVPKRFRIILRTLPAFHWQGGFHFLNRFLAETIYPRHYMECKLMITPAPFVADHFYPVPSGDWPSPYPIIKCVRTSI